MANIEEADLAHDPETWIARKEKRNKVEECTDEERANVIRPELDKCAFFKLVDCKLRKMVEKNGKEEIFKQADVAEGNIKQVKIDRLEWRIEQDRSILMPVYEVSYIYGAATSDCKEQGRRYVFLVNGVTGQYWGERPWGMGYLIRYDHCQDPTFTACFILTKSSKGISALGSILGTDDDDRIGFVEGSLLRRADNNLHYKKEATYLVFPASHSYLVTSATGWIKLKHRGSAGNCDAALELLSWPRKGEKSIGHYTLGVGQEEVFDFRVH